MDGSGGSDRCGRSKTGVPQAVTLTFDRPFLFVIHDEATGQILFVGHFADPG